MGAGSTPLRSALLATTSTGTGSAPGLAAACASGQRATKLPRAATSFAQRRTLGCALHDARGQASRAGG